MVVGQPHRAPRREGQVPPGLGSLRITHYAYATQMNTTQDPELKTQDSFQVRLEVFEGPLDLLLKLIERKQLEISKVSLAEVAGGFLAYLDAHPDMPPGPLASFVWVASKLLWIKSQALLPRPPAMRTEDDEEDPGDELVRRLAAYKRVQDAAKWLRSREAGQVLSADRARRNDSGDQCQLHSRYSASGLTDRIAFVP